MWSVSIAMLLNKSEVQSCDHVQLPVCRIIRTKYFDKKTICGRIPHPGLNILFLRGREGPGSSVGLISSSIIEDAVQFRRGKKNILKNLSWRNSGYIDVRGSPRSGNE